MKVEIARVSDWRSSSSHHTVLVGEDMAHGGSDDHADSLLKGIFRFKSASS